MFCALEKGCTANVGGACIERVGVASPLTSPALALTPFGDWSKILDEICLGEGNIQFLNGVTGETVTGPAADLTEDQIMLGLVEEGGDELSGVCAGRDDSPAPGTLG